MAGILVLLSVAHAQWLTPAVIPALDEGAERVEVRRPRRLAPLEAQRLTERRAVALQERVDASREGAPGVAERVYGVRRLSPAAESALPPPPDTSAAAQRRAALEGVR